MKNDILKNLINFVDNKFTELILIDLRISLGYTIAIIEKDKTQYAGISATLLHDLSQNNGCAFVNKTGAFTNNNTKNIFSNLNMKNSLHRTIALAIVNACFNLILDQDQQDIELVDNTGHIPIEKRNVAMIGFFEPLLKKIKSVSNKFSLYENNPSKMKTATKYGLTLLHDYRDLKQFNTLILTATSIINNTFDEIIEHTSEDTFITIMGPSTPMNADFFIHYYPSINMLSGRKITDINGIASIISQAAGTPLLKNYTKKIEIIIKNEANNERK